jgi:hypothetical protein
MGTWGLLLPLHAAQGDADFNIDGILRGGFFLATPAYYAFQRGQRARERARAPAAAQYRDSRREGQAEERTFPAPQSNSVLKCWKRT